MNFKRISAGVAAAVATVSLAATSFAGPAVAASAQSEGLPGTITDIVAASGEGFDTNGRDYDVLLAAVTAAGLGETLATPGLDVTVWAPKDRAFVRTAQDLGFTGADSDEAGAWAFLVDALTTIGGGDPIPTLTTILQYHVTPDARGPGRVLAATRFPTLAGIGIRHVPGTLALIDKDPQIANPRLVPSALNIKASNGKIHTISRVLLPVNL
ncbi:MAG: fasciclin domain-containing protein [Acidimicrobiales bacterium]|nr:fasciclin domain-containing protein [Acidimicrobiales bacterium]